MGYGFNLNQHHVALVHGQATAKVVTGGAAVGGGTYITVDFLTHATEIATLAATTATALYFLAQFGYVIWKWRKEAHGKT